jgi:hypothetical protein
MLLIVVLLLSVLLGWFAMRMRQAERQRQAVEARRKAGGTVLYDYQFHEESGSATGVLESPVPAWLRELMGEDFFASVAAVGFHDPEVSVLESRSVTVDDADAVLEHVAGLTGVVRLELSANQVTDAGLEHLRGLTELGLLFLHGTHVTEEGSEELRKALPDCQIDWAEEAGPPSSANPASAVVEAWEKAGFQFGWICRSEYAFGWADPPREDDMPGFSFQEGGLPIKSLQGLPQPSVPFGVFCVNVTDAELKELTRLKRLQSLLLLGAQVTDAGVKELAELTELQELALIDTQVTSEGVKKLQQALPNCRIEH